MKSISEIAKQAGCLYENVYRVIINNRFTPAGYNGTIKLYAPIQVDFIFKILYFERKIDYVILESSMNKTVEYYTRESAINLGHITPKSTIV